MEMSIDDSKRYLRLMLGGMKYAVRYWEDKDKEESDIEQTNVEAVKTALDTMRKYQKIEQIIKDWEDGTLKENDSVYAFHEIMGVVNRKSTVKGGEYERVRITGDHRSIEGD